MKLRIAGQEPEKPEPEITLSLVPDEFGNVTLQGKLASGAAWNLISFTKNGAALRIGCASSLGGFEYDGCGRIVLS